MSCRFSGTRFWWQYLNTSWFWITLVRRVLLLKALFQLPQEEFRLKQYGSGALSCVASDGHWVVAGASRSGISNHKEQVTVPRRTLSNICIRGLFVWDLHSGDCVRTIRQGSFPHLVRLHFFLWGWGVGLGWGGRKTYLDCPQCQCAGVWLLCTTLQVLDYPYCWALGSGGRGAVWDLSSGKIVNYFGSNDRWPGWFCFDNFSLFWSSGGFGSSTQMVGKYIGTGSTF